MGAILVGDHHDMGIRHGGLFGNRVAWTWRHGSSGDRYRVDRLYVGRSLYLTPVWIDPLCLSYTGVPHSGGVMNPARIISPTVANINSDRQCQSDVFWQDLFDRDQRALLFMLFL